MSREGAAAQNADQLINALIDEAKREAYAEGLREARVDIRKAVRTWRAQKGPQESMAFRAAMRELEAKHALAQPGEEGRDEADQGRS